MKKIGGFIDITQQMIPVASEMKKTGKESKNIFR